MQGYVKIDPGGWVGEIIMEEVSYRYDEMVAAGYVPVANYDLLCKLRLNQAIMYYDGSQFCQIKDSKNIWKRVRCHGNSGYLATKVHGDLMNGLDDSFPEVSPEIPIALPDPIRRAFEPDFETEIFPGLNVLASTEDDIDIWENSMIAGGLYTPENAWAFAAEWLTDPLAWTIKVVWKGKILQLELLKFNEPSNRVYGSFAAHFDKTRPRWFYKQTTLPVLKSLYSHGFEIILSDVRKDKPAYVDFLKASYGHELLRETATAYHLRLDIRTAISMAGELPQRRTLGPDWKYEAGSVTVREMTETDMPDLLDAIDANWGTNPRKNLVTARLSDTVELDRGTVLIAIKDGKIFNARAFRQREDPTINLAVIPFWFSDAIVNRKGTEYADYTTSNAGFKAWQIAAGYQMSSIFLEANRLNSIFENFIITHGWNVHFRGTDATEFRFKL